MYSRSFLTVAIYCLALQASAGFSMNGGYVPPPPGPYRSNALSHLKPQVEAMDKPEYRSESTMKEPPSPLMKPAQQSWLTKPGKMRRRIPGYGYNYPAAQVPPIPPGIQYRPYYLNRNPVAPMEYYGGKPAYGYPRGGRRDSSYGVPGGIPGSNYMLQQMPDRQMNIPPMWNNLRIPMSNYPKDHNPSETDPQK